MPIISRPEAIPPSLNAINIIIYKYFIRILVIMLIIKVNLICFLLWKKAEI